MAVEAHAFQNLDHFFAGIVLPHHIEIDIRKAHHLKGIRNQGTGRGIDDHMVVAFLEPINQFPKTIRQDQF
ncbi:MAG: hypothetical protein EBZ58_00300, partial [Bacteroidetes bacterium]|nr:hypothetical protein [Bacteroidota bacterium]